MAHPFQKQPKEGNSLPVATTQNPFTKKQRSQLFSLVTLVLLALTISGVSLFFYLKAQQTTLIITEQSPVAITLNGKSVTGSRTKDGVVVSLTAGRYRVGIEKQGFSPFYADITASRGETLVIRPSFILATGSGEATANPETTIESSISFVRSDPSGSSVAFLGDNGERLYRLALGSATATPLTTTPLSEVRDVQWSNDPNLALVVLDDGVYLHEIPLYNFVTQRFDQVATSEVSSPVWDPIDTNRIAALLQTKAGERAIILADKRFTRVQRILSMDTLPDVAISWLPSGDALLLRGLGSGDKQKLWLLKLSNSELTSFDPTDITSAIPSPSGSHILYQQANGSRNILNTATGKSTALNGSGSVAKLAWRNETSFFEPSDDGDSLILRSTDGTQQLLSLTTPPSNEILSVHYLAKAKRIVFATSTELFAVSAP